MILLDGIGDRSYPELGHRTPLQVARTPVLDQLARDGANGLYHAAYLGQALPSENAHFAIFGYDMDSFPGRGALEALGAGIPLSSGEVALLAHFVSVSQAADGVTLVMKEGAPQVSDQEIGDLLRAVEDFSVNGIKVRLNHTGGIRCILTLAGKIAPFVTDSDPIIKGRPLAAVRVWKDFAADPVALNTAHALNMYLEWVYHKLETYPGNAKRREAGIAPVNCLVTQRAGRLKTVASFSEKYGMKGLSIASGIVYHGLAGYLGMEVRKVADTARPGNDLAQRLKTARKLLTHYDFIHVHTKGPDQAAHTKNPASKIKVIEALDKGIGTVLKELMSEPELLIVIASDHSTPSDGPLIHSGEAVPLIFHGPGVRRDDVRHYDEISAAGGALGCVRGKELMYLILNHLDRAKLQGLMDTPVDQPYWPGRYEPFRLNDTN